MKSSLVAIVKYGADKNSGAGLVTQVDDMPEVRHSGPGGRAARFGNGPHESRRRGPAAARPSGYAGHVGGEEHAGAAGS